MTWNPTTQDYAPSPGEHEHKAGLRTTAKVVVGLLVAASCVLLIYFLVPHSKPDRDTTSATVAARTQTPDAQVRNVRVAGGFAMAIVSDPHATTDQASGGNLTVFKVNADGSMSQIATGSSFSPLDLLGLGIPLLTQAKLTDSDIGQVRQSLAAACNYSGGTEPGYSGFDGSFNPGNWQIDPNTLQGLEQALTTATNTMDAGEPSDQRIICVNATRDKSDASTDPTTYATRYTLQMQFVTSDGTLTTHSLILTVGPRYYRGYTLDGHTIGQ